MARRSTKGTTKGKTRGKGKRKAGGGLLAGLSDQWNEVREKKGSGGAGIDIEPGDYTARLQSIKIEEVEYKEEKGEKTWEGDCIQYTITTVIDRGEEEGKKLVDRAQIRDYHKDDGSVSMSEDNALDMFRERLQGVGIDTEDIASKDLEEACEEHAEAEPLVKIKASKNNSGYINLKYKGVVEEDDEDDDEAPFDADEDEEEEDDDVEEDEDDEEEDEEEEEDEDDEEDEVPEKGDSVMYKPKGSRKAVECEVVTVNKSKETVNLKGPKNKPYKAVSWDDIEILFDNEDDE